MRVELCLFDIDGTLVDTGGAGMRALQETAERLFGAEGPELDLAGSTDSGIVMDMHEHFGVDGSEDQVERFYTAYLERLEWNLAHGGFDGRVLPGVVALLESLAGDESVAVGLLTGNIAGGASAKMRHFGLDHHFPFGAFGDDHHDRNELGPVALERASGHAGREFSAEGTLVIGDTPKDIRCAKAMGARCLAVATGSFCAGQLRDHGAEIVVESLVGVDVAAC